MRFAEQVAIVTGSARGIGKEIAEYLAKDGAAIAVVDLKLEWAEPTAAAFRDQGFKATAYAANVADFDQVQAMVKQVTADYGRIDILVNNAGITRDGLLMRMKEEDWNAVIQVNLTGTFNCCKAVARPMAKARRGRIVNIASVVGVMGNPGQANYAASKAGVIGLTKSVAKELAGRNITANAVAPGYIATEMTEHLSEEQKQYFLNNTPLTRPGTPLDVARAVAFLASDEAEFITGQVIHVDGGMLM